MTCLLLDLTDEGDGGEVTDDKAAKQVTTVNICNSAFVSEKLLDMFDEGPSYIDICKRATSVYI